jgi:hypothetical protein
MMNLVLLFPERSQTKTLEGVESFETEWGDENTIAVEYADGSDDTFSGIGVTVSAGTQTSSEES